MSNSAPPPARGRWARNRLWPALVLCALIALLGPFFKRGSNDLSQSLTSNRTNASTLAHNTASNGPFNPTSLLHKTAASPEEVVAAHLRHFGETRYTLARDLARRKNTELTPQIEAFFRAIASGDWDEIERRFKIINGGDDSAGHNSGRPPEVQAVWPAIIDAYGAAEQAHLWPAQKLLDYGNAILDSLRPGMVYVGGTDCGRWIPAMLNESRPGEQHVVITQNGLADSTYLDYARLQFGEQLEMISEDESHQLFAKYVADAQRRLDHDEQHPDEPKQIRPGENVQRTDGKVEVSGQVAVMAINEMILQKIMEKNPDTAFAIQESFPLKGTYPGAKPLGPLMELQASNHAEENGWTQAQATQALSYWQTTAENLNSGPAGQVSAEVLKSYSHDVAASANLLAFNRYLDEAEKAYRLANQLWPGNPESVAALSQLLSGAGRAEEARQLLQDFTAKYPAQRPTLQRLGIEPGEK